MFELMNQILQVKGLVYPILEFMPLRDLVILKEVLTHAERGEEEEGLKFDGMEIVEKITFVFKFNCREMCRARVASFFNWVLKSGVKLTYLAFVGPQDWEFSQLLTRFLCDPTNRSARSLRFLSIFCGKCLSPALFEAIGDFCTNLREIDICMTNIYVTDFFELIRKLQMLEKLVLGSGGSESFQLQKDLPSDTWTRLAQTLSKNLRVLIVLETFSCRHLPDRSVFLNALKTRCVHLEHVNLKVHRFGTTTYHEEKWWSTRASSPDAKLSTPLLTYAVHATRPLLVLTENITSEEMKKIYACVHYVM